MCLKFLTTRDTTELKIFLSYAHEDGQAADRFVKALRAREWQVFWDQDIPSGADWELIIDRELSTSFVYIVMWSKNSVDEQGNVASAGLEKEVQYAAERDRLFQVVLDPIVKPPQQFAKAHATDLSYWNGDPLDEKITAVLSTIDAMAVCHKGISRDIQVKRPIQLRKKAH
jgi:hypothetical protein